MPITTEISSEEIAHILRLIPERILSGVDLQRALLEGAAKAIAGVRVGGDMLTGDEDASIRSCRYLTSTKFGPTAQIDIRIEEPPIEINGARLTYHIENGSFQYIYGSRSILPR